MATVSADQEVAVADEPEKKTPAKKATAKKATAKKATAKKATAKKTAAKKAAKKTPAKKATAKKTTAKKATAAPAPPASLPPPTGAAQPASSAETNLAGAQPAMKPAAGPKPPDPSTPLSAVRGDLRTLGRLVDAYRRGDYREVPATKLALVAAGIAYVVSPVDLVPDFLPVGILDDVLVASLVIRAVKTEVDSFARWEQRHKDEQPQLRA